MKKILIIEDDKDIADLLSLHLKDLPADIEFAHDGRIGLDKALSTEFNLIILDIMLPSMDGIEICRRIKIAGVLTPIIMLTAKSEEIDKVLGLELGANDYITKPFSIREFLARVKAIFRFREMLEESLTVKNDILDYGNLKINIEKRKILLNGEKIELSPKEFELLVHLSSNPGQSYSRAQLLNLIWGYNFDGYEHTINSHINRLRSKIEPDMNNPIYILTTWAVGYRFTEEIA